MKKKKTEPTQPLVVYTCYHCGHTLYDPIPRVCPRCKYVIDPARFIHCNNCKYEGYAWYESMADRGLGSALLVMFIIPGIFYFLFSERRLRCPICKSFAVYPLERDYVKKVFLKASVPPPVSGGLAGLR